MVPLLDRRLVLPAVVLFSLIAHPAWAVILWSDLGATLVHESGPGTDILGGVVQRDDTATNTLYFKFHVDPLSDVSTEEYFAAFQLFEGDTERLGIGNSMKAWAYSAFNTTNTGEFNKVFGDLDLKSSRPESSSPGVFLPYELPRRGIENTIVVKVQYIAGADDLITVWLNPDMGPGATEASQPATSTSIFGANASFDQIRIRHDGGGGGWTFSDMAIATSFADFVGPSGVDAGGEPAPGKHSAALTFRAWQREQGLPQNTVRALTQTRDGYLWIGSDDGITRFDGVRFVSFGLRDGWRNGRVRALLPDSSGSLWIGTAGGGLVRWQQNRFTTFTVAQGLPNDSITSLAEDSQNKLWIGTESGLAIFQNGVMTNLAAKPEFKDKTITTLLKDKRGLIWVGVSGEGVFRYLNGQFERLSDPAIDGLLLDSHCLLEDRSGRIWLGAGDDFVLCREGEQWRRYRLPRHLARPYVTALAEEADGTVWAGSVSEGLFQFRAGKLITINANSGLSDNFIQSLLVDREGNLWVGTAAGLNRLRRGNLAVLGQNEGLGYGPVCGMAEVAPGHIWACKPNDGLYYFQGSSFSRLLPADANRRYADVNSLLPATDGSCFVATARGLLLFRDVKTRPLEEAQIELPNKNVICLARGPDGRAYAGTREGEVWTLNQAKWELQINLSQTHPISAIVGEGDGAFWIGTEGGGLHRIKGTERIDLDSRHGLLSDVIRTIHLDAAGDLWVGSGGGGLGRYRAGHVTTFTSVEGLPDNTVSQILEDGRGRLWLGTDRGLACISKADLDALASGRLATIYPQIYGRPEGMPSEECTGGFFPAGLKTRSGQLWFSTSKGIVVADAASQDGDLPPPTVVLEEVLIDGLEAKVAGVSPGTASGVAGETPALPGENPAIRIPPGRRGLEFRYTGLSLRAPERIRFRYRLEGLETDWVEAGTRRSVSYAYVPPGDYSFQVTACNSDGAWNKTHANLKFTVMRHFWQARWFLALMGLGLIGSVAGAVRIVEKRKHQRRLEHLEQERAVQRERARIAQDLHDDLGSSLTRLSLLSDLLKADKEIPAQVEVHATKITQSAGQTVRALEEIVWALRPGSDTLQSLVEYISHFANELFEGDRTRCRLDFPHDLPSRPLPPEMRHNIFLIIKEALTNALKHAQANEVRVQAKVLPGAVQFVVQDDGQGFNLQSKAAENNQRHGLGNMQRRAEAMRAKLDVQTSAGGGTSVKLVVPFPA
jgi:ligand-binding sensor domain-containing protein/signal transduction histidine kinase